MRTYRSTKDIAVVIRENLKKELPDWKFSVRVENYSGGSAIHLSLMSGPEEALLDTEHGKGYAQLNHYTFLNDQMRPFDKPKTWNNGAVLTASAWQVMSKAAKILSAEHWDDSDAQIDYFSCNFYRHLNIGQWNKPYQVKG